MSERSPTPAEKPCPMEALNEVLEVWLEFAGPKQSRQFLRAMASRLACPPDDTVVRLRGPRRLPASPRTKAWLHEQLPGWLSRYG